MVTPFTERDERIDFDAWQRILDGLIAAHVDGVAVAGGQGEFFSLTMEERSLALRFCVQAVAKRIPVYGNVGCVNTRETMKLAMFAEKVGVKCLIVVTPFYLKPSPGELLEHYRAVCRSVSIPVLANVNPERTGVDLPPDTVARIADECENFAGVKDSTGLLQRIHAYANACAGRKLAVFTGSDDMLSPALSAGAAGSFSACANIAPRLFVDLYGAVRRGYTAEAARLQALAKELNSTLSLHTFPGVLKEAMQLAGLPAGVCRKPVSLMPEHVRDQVRKVLGKLSEAGYIARTMRVAGA